MLIALVLIVAFSLINLGFAVVALHKIQRVHLMSYEIQRCASIAEQESRTFFAQMQALLSLERLLALPRPLPPLRGWSASPDFMLILVLHVLDKKPMLIIECGSGASTVALARALQINGAGKVVSLDHEITYVEQTRAALVSQSLAQWAEIVHAPLVAWDSFADVRWYSFDNLSPASVRAEMLVIDGPPAGSAPLARYPALALLSPFAAEGADVFLDDADREGERSTVEKWQHEGYAVGVEHLPAEKGCVHFRLAKVRAGAPEMVGTD